MAGLIQPLPDRPVDIVGDIHGEIDALKHLLLHLGYDDDGCHRFGRQLVFVGDLVNRGPDSPAVVSWVRSVVQARRAHCVLGNHELNLLIGNRKASGNWFYGESQLDDEGRVIPQRLADESTRHQIRDWLQSLPLALIGTDLRVVHACWDADMIELLRGQTDVLQLFEHYRAQIESELIDGDDEIQQVLAHQNRNPALRLTSGPRERLASPGRGARRVQHTRLVPWWTRYDDDELCVFGHYSHEYSTFLGSRSSFCIDFGVGRRWTERRVGTTDSFGWKLAALRIPEMELVFDDGSRGSFSSEEK